MPRIKPRSAMRLGAAMSLSAALLVAAACVRMAPPMIVPPSAEEKAAAWRLVRVGPEGGVWVVEAIFVPGGSEAVLAEADLSADLDGQPVPFAFDPGYQRLRASFPTPPSGDHLFTAAPARAHDGSARLSVRFTVAP